MDLKLTGSTQSWFSQCKNEILQENIPCDFLKYNIKVLPSAATTMHNVRDKSYVNISKKSTLQLDNSPIQWLLCCLILKTSYPKHCLKWKYISGSVWDNAAWQTGERGPHSPLCPQPFDGITMWTSQGRITAYIYHRSCLIRLALLYPIVLRRKALLAHSSYNLIIHWCNLNEPKPLKSKAWTIRQESMRKFSPTLFFCFWIFKLGLGACKNGWPAHEVLS